MDACQLPASSRRSCTPPAPARSGLVIDVRENGGGSTTDHLLTALTQPVHAITVPRGGGPGYPQDRKVYATWNKPIVVLCNQNSFSQRRDLQPRDQDAQPRPARRRADGRRRHQHRRDVDHGRRHAAAALPRLVRARHGEDMELNGAVPHHVVWPEPGELPAGKDVQIEKAVEVLLADVQEWTERPQPKLRKATER